MGFKTLILSLVIASISTFLYFFFRPYNQKEVSFLLNSVFLYILLFIVLQPLMLNIKTENIIEDMSVFIILFLYIFWFTISSLLIYFLTPIQAITINSGIMSEQE
jgi:hypothetical protein